MSSEETAWWEWIDDDGRPDPAPAGVHLVETDESLFDGAPPIRSYSDGSQVYGPYGRSSKED